MRKFKSILFLTCMLAGSVFTNSVFAQTDELTRKREVITEILTVSGAVKQMESVVDQVMSAMMPLLKQSIQASKIPQESKDKFIERFPINFVKLMKLPENTAAFLEPSVQQYAENFTLVELQELLSFQASPLGKKLALLQPEMMKRSAEIGAVVGRRIGAEAGAMTGKEISASK